jgi:c-di-GMP-binding flagellar brake protein YcgR
MVNFDWMRSLLIHKRGEVAEKPETKSHIGVVNLERRKHPRFSVDLPIEYSFIHSPISVTSRALNASEGGLLVYLAQPIEMGQHLKIKLFFASGSHLNSIEVLAKVVWMDIHFGKDWGDYRCGVEFVDISQQDLNDLKSFLKNLSE